MDKNNFKQTTVKKVIMVTILLILLTSLFLAVTEVTMSGQGDVVMASNVSSNLTNMAQDKDSMQTELNKTMDPLKNFFSAVVSGVLAVIIIMVAIVGGVKCGLTWMMAADEEGRKKGKIQLFNVVIGVVIAMCALGIISPFIGSLGNMFGTSVF